ncbi:MAG: hypothetical protein II457_01090 [Paludibacteraceae bacterium]|jgi:hypothetical protein|nr:hypothetical protein [Paludibacteraceae bacterium]
MKKLMMVAMAVIVAIGALAQPKTSDKAIWKQAQKKAKELTKQGWKVDGSKTLDVMLFDHYKKLQDQNNQELIANVVGQTNIRTLNQAQRWAIVNAATSYATQAKMMVVGRVTSEVGGAAIQDLGSPDDFYAAYESRVATELQGELKQSISVYREKKDGGLEYKIFYLVNEESASKARMRAMERAIQESEFARANAERISDFVREGFKVTAE